MLSKRIVAALLILLIFTFAGCANHPAQIPEDPIPTDTTPPDPGVSTTLMVYMIGSDLEAKTAAGTKDLEEMTASGVDLTNTNVLVYAGGSPYWHNEMVEQDVNTILALTQEGFSPVHTEPAVSMGEAETLTSFLEYGYANYPAERFALILWNHGSGPVRGYGQDLVFEGGSLLLSEMQSALDASPFGTECPLAFVGFDACLMASAELACIWDDYAQYMISSQEVEPSIGWNYRFLESLTASDLESMLRALTDDYLASCEQYYAEKKYDSKETTLSCVKLGDAAQLEQAINALFAKAATDVNLKYDQLSALRVNTRAYGRASTGSEYDLVDLGDLAKNLSVLYPEETAKILQILDSMVLSNANNTQLCSGLSLYYPFYNKDYFFRSIRGADSWQKTYQELGLFPDYQMYLQSYQQIWNSSDRLENYAQQMTPTEQAQGVYTLQLTPEQNETYTAAKYYILKRQSSEMYTCIFASSDVTNDNGCLTANFDGNIIYATNKYKDYIIPVVEELDRIGDLSHYSIYVGLDNQLAGTDLFDAVFIGDEHRFESYRYHLVLDKQNKSLSVSGLLPYDQNYEDLVGGKLEDADLSQWASVLFWDHTHRYLTRDEHGLILPLNKWYENDIFTGTYSYFVDDLSFIYEPLGGGEYYLMIEMQDTQGSRYCSELLPITTQDSTLPTYDYPETTVQWQSGDRVLVAQQNGVSVYLNKIMVLGKTQFTLELENQNSFGANLDANTLICNETIYCEDYWGSIHSDPHQSAWFTSISSLGLPEECGTLSQLKSISFTMQVRDELTGAMLIEPQVYCVELSQQLTDSFQKMQDLKDLSLYPFLGAKAQPQLLYSDDRLQIELMGLGAQTDSSWDSMYGIVRIENKTDAALRVGFDGAAVNGQYVPIAGGVVTIPAGHSTHLDLEMSSYEAEQYGITQVEDLSLLFRVIRATSFFSGFSEPVWCDVELTERGSGAEPFLEAEHVIYDKQGIRIAINEAYTGYSSTRWEVTIYNGSSYGVEVELLDEFADGVSTYGFIDNAQVGPGQYSRGELFCPIEGVQELIFRVQIRDFYGERVLYTDNEVITITGLQQEEAQ